MMELTADSQVVALLCSRLGLPEAPEFKPLTLREWNRLVRRLVDSPLESPGALLETNKDALESHLMLSDGEAQRVSWLLQRGGGLAIALERLESRGIWLVTRADPEYPRRLRRRLKQSAPTLLFGAGERELIGQPGVAVVGSRAVNDRGKECAELVGNAVAREGWVLYSGGARGVDSLATNAALEGRGTAVSALAHSLEKAVRVPENRSRVVAGDLAMVTPYSPSAGFSVGAAMGRNRLIYAMADYALVIASDAGKGGTWAGASEALKAGWAPVFVLDGSTVPDGNRQLQQRGAIALPESLLTSDVTLRDWLEAHTPSPDPDLRQGRLL